MPHIIDIWWVGFLRVVERLVGRLVEHEEGRVFHFSISGPCARTDYDSLAIEVNYGPGARCDDVVVVLVSI